jgi:hypothetical protein
MPNKEVISWWDDVHTRQDQIYLNGASIAQSEWNVLEVNELLAPKQNVLYIGAGMGAGIKDLRTRGLAVSCLDITPVAEAIVKNHIDAFYLDAKDLPKNHFDLVLSHLVAQHTADIDLSYQMEKVLSAMTKTATFAMQYFLLRYGQTSLLPDLNNNDLTAQKTGHVGRTKNDMLKLIENSKGRILKWGKVISFNELPGKPMWQTIHFGK